MRRCVATMAAFVFALNHIGAINQAFAAPPPRVKGERCTFPRVPAGMWIGFFDGYKEETSPFTLRDGRRHVTLWRCFKTQGDCMAWKYWMQTDYSAGPKVTWCRKK